MAMKVRSLAAILVFLWGTLLSAQNIVTISNARRAEYGKDPVTGGDSIILVGAVEVSVEDGGAKTVISAERVSVNREKDLLYAEGGIALVRTSSGNTENMSAESLLINTKTFEGVFDGARIVSLGSGNSASATTASTGSSGSTLIVSADLFGRDSAGTMAFKNGTLTFCDDENPHWKINASRIWLLPGEEFALLNMVLWVGRLPVFYMPFFYYPKDELVFNPVVGMEDRRGWYFQTTTYVIGRKPLNKTEDDSQFNFMKLTSLKEQRLEGLILRNLDENMKETPKNTLKILGDYYTNLGGIVGAESIFVPKTTYISGIDFSFYAGFSNTVFPASGSSPYSRYARSGTVYADSSNFLGLEIPFRYMANFNIRIVKPLSITVAIPLYSDPFFKGDFLTNREESMDWLSYLTSNKGETLLDQPNTVTGTEISSFNWTLNSSYNVPVTPLNPFISALSLTYKFELAFATTSTTTAQFSAEEISDGLPSYSPMRRFYYPSRMTPANVTAGLSGTLLSYPTALAKTTRTSDTAAAQPKPALKPPEVLGLPVDAKETETSADPDKTPEEELSAESAAAPESPEAPAEAGESPKESTEESAEESSEADALLPGGLPEIKFTAPSVSASGGVSYKLSYTVSPNMDLSSAFPVTPLPASSDDISWNTISSYLVFKSPVTLQNTVSWRDSFIGMDNAVTFSPVYQTHFMQEKEKDENGNYKPNNSTDRYINYGYTDDEIKKNAYNDYKAQSLDTSLRNSVSFKPLVYNPYFSGTSISWNTNIKLIRTNYLGETPSSANNNAEPEAEWEYLFPEWDEESITAHSLNLSLAAKESDFSQTVTLSSSLPPLVEHYTGSLSLGWSSYVTLTAASGYRQTSKTDPTWKWDTFTQNLSIKLFSSKLTLSESLDYNIEDDRPTSLRTSVSGYGLQFSYQMLYTNAYELVQPNGGASWTWLVGEQKFLPTTLGVSYSTTAKTLYSWKNRMSLLLNFSTTMSYDLIRPTMSYFTFAPKLTFVVNQFLNLSFSATSRNNAIFWYTPELFNFPDDLMNKKKDLFTDLFNSFTFWDEEKLRDSPFKLQTLSFSITHEMHDWLLNSSFSYSPRLVTKSSGGYAYADAVDSFIFTLSVLWRPMQSIKASIEDKYGEFALNPKTTATTK